MKHAASQSVQSEVPQLLSESRYREVVEDLTEVICRFLPDGTITFVNDIYCRKFGKSSTELIGQRWHPLAHPDDVPVIEAKLRQMSMDNPVVVIENRVFVDGGDLRWMQFVNRGFYRADGSVIEIQSVGRDITALKQVEAALRESETALQHAQAVASIGSFGMGRDPEQFTYTSETARLFGLDDQGQTTFGVWFSRVHPDDQAAVEAAWRDALQGAPYDMTYRIVVRGQVIWIRALAELIFDEQGHLLSGVGTVQDITAQKQAADALRESEERLEMALAGSGLALWDWDMQTHEVTWGGRVQEMLGLSVEERRSEADWLDLIDPRDREKFQRVMTAYLEGEVPDYHSEHRLRHKDGHWVTVEARGKVTARDDHGAALRMVGTLLDISQRKRLNEEGIHLLRQIEKLIHESTSTLPASGANAVALESLTNRERQILGMVAGGMTSAQIAGQLKVATNTVISHRQT